MQTTKIYCESVTILAQERENPLFSSKGVKDG